METLKIPVCVTLAIIVWLSCVKSESSIVCNGRDFECEGTKRFLTCVYLPDGQKLFSPNDCLNGTFCNDANPTSQPCDTNPVIQTTDSTSPTSTADPATRLAEATTLPYIRPTVVPQSAIIANSLTYSKIGPNKNPDPRIQDLASTIPDNAPDTIYVDFDVDVSSNSSAFDNNSTLISRIISVENPSVIKTSAVVKLVASNKTAAFDSKEQPPKIATNTSIASKEGVKSPRYVISTSMHTLFRSSELTADSVITVAGGSSNQSSVTVNVDTGIENSSSNDVIVTTNTTVSLGAAGSAFTSTSTSISNQSSDAISALPIADSTNLGTTLVGDKLDEESSTSKPVDSSSNNGTEDLESKSDDNVASNNSSIFNETKVSPIPTMNLNKENGVYNHSVIEESSNLKLTSVSPVLTEGQSEVVEISSQPLTTEVVKSEQNNEKENPPVVTEDYEPLTRTTEYRTTLSHGQNTNNDVDSTTRMSVENPSNNVEEVGAVQVPSTTENYSITKSTDISPVLIPLINQEKEDVAASGSVPTSPSLNNIPLSTSTPRNIVVEQTGQDDPEKNVGPTEFKLDGQSEIAATSEKELTSNEVSTLKFVEDSGKPEGVGNSTLSETLVVTASSAINTGINKNYDDTPATKLGNEWSSTPNPIPMKLNTGETQATLDITQDDYINLRTSSVRQSVEIGHYLNSLLDEVESTTEPEIAETTITTTSKKDEIEISTVKDNVKATTSLNSITDKVQTTLLPDERNSGTTFVSPVSDQTEKDRMDSKLSDITSKSTTSQFDEFVTTEQSVQTGDSTSSTTTSRQVRHDGDKPKKQSAAQESNLSFITDSLTNQLINDNSLDTTTDNDNVGDFVPTSKMEELGTDSMVLEKLGAAMKNNKSDGSDAHSSTISILSLKTDDKNEIEVETSTAIANNLQKGSSTESAIQQDAEKKIFSSLGLVHEQDLKSVTVEQFVDVTEVIPSQDLDKTSYIQTISGATNLPEVTSSLSRTTRETTAAPVTEAILVKEYRTPAWTGETLTTITTKSINSDEFSTLKEVESIAESVTSTFSAKTEIVSGVPEVETTISFEDAAVTDDPKLLLATILQSNSNAESSALVTDQPTINSVSSNDSTTVIPAFDLENLKSISEKHFTDNDTIVKASELVSEINTLNILQPTQTGYFAGLDTEQNSTLKLVHEPSAPPIEPERRVDSVESSTIPSAAMEVKESESGSGIQKAIIKDKNSSSDTTNVGKVPEELRSPLENKGDMAVNSNQSKLINTANGIDTISYEAQKEYLVENNQDLSPIESPVIERVTDISAYILKDRIGLGSSNGSLNPPLVNEKDATGEVLKESPVENNQNLRPETILITEMEANNQAYALEGAINHNIPVGSSNPSIEEENTTISKVPAVSEKSSVITASLGAKASGNAHTTEETESSHNNTDYSTVSPNWPNLNDMKSHPSTLETTFKGYKPEAPLGQTTENKAAYPTEVLQTNSEAGKFNKPSNDRVLTVEVLDGSNLKLLLSEEVPAETQKKDVVSETPEIPEPSLVVVEEIESVGISEPGELQGRVVVGDNSETFAMVEQEVNSSGNRTSGNDHESIIAAADFSNSQNILEEDLKVNDSKSKKFSKSETSNKSQTKPNHEKTREGKSIGFDSKPNSTFVVSNSQEVIPAVPLTPGFDIFLSSSSIAINGELTTTETVVTEVQKENTTIPASTVVSERVETVQRNAGDIVSSPLPGKAEKGNPDEVNNGLRDTKIGTESTLSPEVGLGQNLQPESNVGVLTTQASPSSSLQINSTTIGTTASSTRELAVETNEVQQTTPSSLESATKLPEIGVKERTEPESFSEGTQTSTVLIHTTSTEPNIKGPLTSGPISVPAEQVALATVSSNTKEIFMCTAHGVFPDNNNCRQYFLCVQQAPGYVKIGGLCPPRFAFSSEAQRCVRDVSSCYESKCDIEGNYPDPLDDSSYFWCTENSTGVFHKYHLQCDYPMKFIPSTGICDDPKKLEEVSFVERTTQVEATTENIASNTVEFETTQPTSEGYLDEIPTTVLIELEYREMAVATNKYETAFIESFPIDEKHHIATGVSRSNVQESVTSNAEESLVRIARHAAPKKKTTFKCTAHGSFANPNDCTKYFICFRRGRTNFAQINGTCQDRNAFNPETRSCSRDLAICPDLQCEEPGNFAHPYEQNSYFRCIYNSTGGFQKYHIKCPPKMKYYPLLDVCSDGRKMHLARTLTPEQIEVFESGVQSIDPQLESPKESPKDSDEDIRSEDVVDEKQRRKAEKRLRKILERLRNEAYEREEASERRRREHEKDILKRRGHLNVEEGGGDVKQLQEKFKDSQKGKAIEEFRCNDLGHFPDPKNCHRYYICTIKKKDKLKKHHMYCDESLRFDSRRRICVHADEAHCA